jgi:alkanesulfonate monooxygenase SsuD/methylene tetrahydromethanopterin reductase-like flavin-dependent oxidoreductase (luciferase family)
VARTDPERTGHQRRAWRSSRSSPGLRERIWWGSGTRATAQWAARTGMNLQSSTLLTEDTGVPFDQLQAEQIEQYRAAWAEQGWDREPAGVGVAAVSCRSPPTSTGCTSAARRTTTRWA